MLRMSRIFNFLKKKDPIFRKIRENFGNLQIIQKIIQTYSVVSPLPGHRGGQGADLGGSEEGRRRGGGAHGADDRGLARGIRQPSASEENSPTK